MWHVAVEVSPAPRLHPVLRAWFKSPGITSLGAIYSHVGCFDSFDKGHPNVAREPECNEI